MTARLLLCSWLCLALACSDGAESPDVVVVAGGGAAGASSGGIGGQASSGAGGAKAGGGQAGGGASAGGASPSFTRYPYGPTHAPLTSGVVAGLKARLATSTGRSDVFAKVGASNTVAQGFAHCFAGPDVKLASHAALAPTVDFFKKTLADATATSFDRVTLAATVGWGAKKTIEGQPSPIEAEVASIRPQFAVVLLGTNDTYDAGVAPFDDSMNTVIERLLSLGVVPIITTIPPRRDTAAAEALVPEMNAILRGVAEANQVPFVDLFSVLDALPSGGVGADGIHLPTYTSGGAHGCWLDDTALASGMNQRNLLTLEALDRMRRIVIGADPVDAVPPSLLGAGTFDDPIVVDALPFVHHADTSAAPPSTASHYACGSQDEGGPEIVYRLSLSSPQKLSIRVFDDASTDVDLHFLTSADAGACVARDDRALVVDAPAGTSFLAVDTFVSGGKPAAGRYRLTIVPR